MYVNLAPPGPHCRADGRFRKGSEQPLYKEHTLRLKPYRDRFGVLARESLFQCVFDSLQLVMSAMPGMVIRFGAARGSPIPLNSLNAPAPENHPF